MRSMLALETRIVFDGAVQAAAADPHDAAALAHKAAVAGQAIEAARPPVFAAERVPALSPDRAPADTNGNATPTTILFIDASVKNAESLLAGLKDGVEVVMLDKNSDGVQQIADALKDRHGLDSIQIVSEGNDGRVLLGSTSLADSNIDSYRSALAGWGSALRDGGDILLFGCNVANGSTGEHFINRLAELTGADVAASTDATGSVALGGNWALERQTGQIEAGKALGDSAMASYDGLLLTGNGTADGTYDFGGNLGSPRGDGYSALNDKLLVSDTLTQDPGSTILYDVGPNSTVDGAAVTVVFKAEGTTVAKHFTFNDFAISAYDHTRTVDQLTVVLADVNGNTIATLQMPTSTVTLGTTATQLSTLINGGVAWSYANVATVTLTLSFWKTTDHGGDGGSPSEFNLESITVSNISASTVNTAPTFVGAVTNLAVPQNGGTFDIRSLLHVSDADSGQTETWSVSGAPAHGTLSISGANSASGSTDIAPGGTITYTPAAGFAGTDSFTIQVSDGTSTTTRTINVSVAPATPGTPDLAAASDSGPSTTDNITNGTSLTFSGTSAAGDTTSVVRVFIDVNADGVYTGGTDRTATATVNNGAWTVSGVSTVGVADGVYNVYAISTSAVGAVSSARSAGLAVTIDKTAPGAPSNTIVLGAASDSGSSNSDRITSVTSPTVRVSLVGTGAGTNNVVELLLGGAALGTPTRHTLTGADVANGYVDLSVTSGDLGADGVKVLTARFTDVAGNVGSAGGAVTITLDTTAPAAPSTPALASGSDSDSGVSNSDRITNVTTPVITGTAESGSTVTLYDTDGTTVLGSAIASGGAWSITSSTLGQGAHSLTVKATDTAGNVSAASGALSVTVDTTAPATPATPTLASASDSGASNSDRVTSDTTPVINGTAESGSIVTLYDTDGSTVLGTAVASGGAWSITSSTLSQGAHSLTVKATDAAGNVSAASGALSVTVDTTAPATPATLILASASDSGVSNSDRVTSDTTPVINGMAENGSIVILYDSDGSTVLGTAVASGGVWSIISSALADGTHTLTVKASDAAGNVSAASAALSVTIDSTAPAAPAMPTLASSSDSGTSNTDRITNITTPVFNGTAESGSIVTLYDSDGTTVLGNAVASGGVWSIISSALADGTHTLTVKAGDTAGNVSAASAALSVTIDTGAPATPSAPTLDSASDSGASSSDGVTSVTTPVFNGTAESGSTVTLYDSDGTTVLGSAVASGGVWSITSATLATGPHTLTAKATDAAGNVSAASAALSVTIDTSAPATPSAPTLDSASDSGVSNSDGITRITTPVFNGTAESGAIITLYDTDGSTVLGSSVASGGVWSITSSALADGTHTLTVKASNISGNSSAASAALNVTIDTSEPSAPAAPILDAASDTGSSASDGITRINTPTVTGSAENGSTVTLYDSDGVTVLGSTTARDGAWSITSAPLSDGTHALVVRTSSAAGTPSAVSAALLVTVDTQAPALAGTPQLASGGTSTLVATPDLKGTVDANSTVTVRSNGQTIGTVQADANGNWSLSPQLGLGLHEITVTATDAAGNTGPASAALTLNVLAPPPQVIPEQRVIDTQPPRLSGIIESIQAPMTPVGSILSSDVGQSPLARVIASASDRGSPTFTLSPPTSFANAWLPAGGATVMLNREIGNVSLEAGQRLSYTIPRDTFITASGSTDVALRARLADGSPLPDWLKFDPLSGTFSGSPPAGEIIALTIEVIAKDARGNDIKAVFEIHSRKADSAPPQASLSGTSLLMALGLDSADVPPSGIDAAPGTLPATALTDSLHATGALSEQLAREAKRFSEGANSTLQHLTNI